MSRFDDLPYHACAVSGAMVLLAVSLTACANTSDGVPSPIARAAMSAPAYEFAARQAETKESLDFIDFAEAVGGAEFVSLVTLADTKNLELAQASARVAQAEARIGQSLADLRPSLSGSPSIGLSRAPQPALGSDGDWDAVFSGTLSAGWNLDIFGAERREVDAARLRAAATDLALKNTKRQVLLSLSRTYVSAWALSEQIAVNRALIISLEDTLRFTTARYEAGARSTSALDVQIARQNLAAAQANVSPLLADLDRLNISISVLIGQLPKDLELEYPNLNASLPSIDPLIGVPADVLRDRPDVALAELNYLAAIADLDSARARLRPTLSLSGSISRQSGAIDEFFDPEQLLVNLGANLLNPLYQGGRLRARVKEAEARAEEVSAAYGTSILTAIADVETATSRVDAFLVQTSELERSLAAAELSEQLARTRYIEGQTSLLSVLETQRALNSARQNLVLAKERLLLAQIDLYFALGGNMGDAQ